MTTYVGATEAILAHFVDEWDDKTPFTFENEDFNPGDEAWVRVSIRTLTSGQETLGEKGNRKFGRRGAIHIQIYCPTNKGTAEINGLVQAVQSMFEGRRIVGTTIRFLRTTPRELGTDGPWLATRVETIFDYDEVK